MNSEALVTCAQCGAQNRAGARFCDSCGAALAKTPARRQARKVVTALFCDVTGSTALGEELDPEVLRGVLNRYFAEIRAIIERHGGTVEKFIGDAVMAVFGIPRVHEDDALRAVRAAAEIRERLPAVAQETRVELRFRTGVNTGSVLVGEGENLAVGDAVNVAARLEQTAQPGEIVLGEETLALVRDAVEVDALEPLELKGKSEPVPAYRLVSIDPAAAEGFARHMDVRLVGREREVGFLRHAWDRTLEESHCHVLTLLGEAGVGKSRLVAELLAQVGDAATVLRGRCLHYGEGITFWPIVEALMPLGERAQSVVEHLNGGSAATPEELFWEVRRLLESVAGERALVLYLDDLQWAEPMLLDLLDHISDLSRGAPILLLCTARPELLDNRPGWGGGRLTATTVLLEPLGGADSELLLNELGDSLDAEARARVIEASEGNPLFLEEIAALARERGTVEVPSTIQALLAARLERLALEERELLERGAVEGEVFHRLAVKALADERLATEVGLRLSGLVRKELIRPHPSMFSGDEAFRFRHLLIRDAAYDALPKATRAELHGKFARWLERHASELLELDEIAGWHLEQALRYQQELGREVDPRLAVNAVEHLYAAGRRAAGRGDAAAAMNLLDRALSLTSRGDRPRSQIAVELADQMVERGDYERVDEMLEIANQEPSAARWAALTRLLMLLRSQPHGATQAVRAQLPGLMDQLTAAGDERGLARAHFTAAFSHWLASRAADTAHEFALSAEYARRAGDSQTLRLAVSMSVGTVVAGPASTNEMAARLDELDSEDLGPAHHAFVQLGRSEVARLEGRLDDARVLLTDAGNTFNQLGTLMEDLCGQAMAKIHEDEGDLAGALELLRRCDAGLEKRRETSFRSTTQAIISEVALQMGDHDAARAAADLAEELGAPEDVINYVICHGVRARLALAQGDVQEGERWARSAVQNALKTDFPIEQAGARLALSRVLSRDGRVDEARQEAQAALDLYEAKGYRLRASQARAWLDQR